MEHALGCTAFLVHLCRVQHDNTSGGSTGAQPEEHGLDLDAVHHGFNMLLRVGMELLAAPDSSRI